MKKKNKNNKTSELLGIVFGKEVRGTEQFMKDLENIFPDKKDREKFIHELIEQLASEVRKRQIKK